MYKDDGEYNKSEELGTKRRKIIKDDEHNLELVAAAEEENRISKLPQEVVVRIVSLLTLKEAAATSILSRRWRYAWASTTTLNLDAVNFEDRPLDENILNQEGRKYVNWVNRVLEQHIEAKESSSTSAGLAMEKRVQSLKVIRFRHVAVTGELVEFLLSNCLLLERVSLTIARDLVNLRVVGPLIALKHLEIKYC
ncbi:hypothetical protein GBA52_022519 [Prunus armeniaca]|nr:hypothetical protein GBA52_022519 [Prunus armeniaca]